jgi:hypothetical protein
MVNIDLTFIRKCDKQIRELRDGLQRLYPKYNLYLPFQFRSGELSMMSNYFAKAPLKLVQILFDGTNISGDRGTSEGQQNTQTLGEEKFDRGGFLEPFKKRADTDYVISIIGGTYNRGRRHETLVNEFANYLKSHQLEIGYNAAIDLGVMRKPPVIIEAKQVESWQASIREAVGQLYEYRFFEVADPSSTLIFLASKPVPKEWIRYLEVDRHIGVAWKDGSDFVLSNLAKTFLSVP